MSKDKEDFDIPRIAAGPWLRGVEFRNVVESTNSLAKEFALRPAIETPLLVLAGRQTAGRGRGANRWWSSDGALTFSLVIEAHEVGLSPEDWCRVSLTAALAVCEAVGHFAPDHTCGIKWPNDVFLGGRKLCGVLVEVPATVPPVPTRLVVGIGVNVNNSLSEAPAEVRAVGTSIHDATGRRYDLTEVLVEILKRFGDCLAQLRASDNRLVRRWWERSLLNGRTLTVDTARRRVRGRCKGIGADGSLELETDAGVVRLHSGVILRVEPDLRADP